MKLKEEISMNKSELAAKMAEKSGLKKVDAEKAKKWIATGAQPTDTVKAIFKKNGVI